MLERLQLTGHVCPLLLGLPEAAKILDMCIETNRDYIQICIPRDPGLIVLNMWNSLSIDPLTWELIELLLCAARNLIAALWKTPQIPSVSDWYLKIWDYFLQDKILVSILHSNNLPVPNNL